MSLFAGAFLAGSGWAQTQEPLDTTPMQSQSSPWETGVGEGFRRHAHELNLSAGLGLGMRVFGSGNAHDWVLGTLEYGTMLSGVVARDRWFRGNWELVGEVFGAQQYHPNAAYAVGVAPHLRYNFATGYRWVPFLDGGAGVTATDIRNGDLSTTFEFNLQLGAGVHYFLRDDLALTLQYRFIHLSNANIDTPNRGLNNSTMLVGLSWFF